MVNTHRPTVSIIIPIHEGGEYFRLCLSSVAQLSPAPMEVIVVADGEIGEDAGLVREFSFNLIQLPFRQGPACARNMGAREAKGELLFFVDADVVVPQDALELVLSVFEQGSEVAAVFGSYDDEPAASSFLSQYRNLFHHYVHQSANPEASTFWAGCGVIRRDFFLELGGFDERYGVPAIEDIELGHRLRLAGCRVRLLKTLQVKHLKYWGVRSLVATDFFQRALPWSRLILRSRWMINDLNLRTGDRLSVILIFGLLGCLLLAPFSLKQAELAGLLVAALVSLNLPIILFFLKKRGIWFAVRAVPWLWFYYFYSGLAFAIETACFGFQALKGLLIKKTLAAPCPPVEDHTEAR